VSATNIDLSSPSLDESLRIAPTATGSSARQIDRADFDCRISERVGFKRMPLPATHPGQRKSCVRVEQIRNESIAKVGNSNFETI